MSQLIKIATTAILACIMLVVTLTSHLGLSYCLCQGKLILSDCICEHDTAIQSATGSHSGCCSSNGCSSNSFHTSHSASPSEMFPCDDCDIEIDWSISHSILNFTSNHQLTSSDADQDQACDTYFTSLTPSHLKIVNTRGSPPPPSIGSHYSTSVPIYKRHSAFLI